MSGSAGGLNLWGGEGLSRRLETKHRPTLLGPHDDWVIKASRLVQIIDTAARGGPAGKFGIRRSDVRNRLEKVEVRRLAGFWEDKVSLHSCFGLHTEENICINLSTTSTLLWKGMQAAMKGRVGREWTWETNMILKNTHRTVLPEKTQDFWLWKQSFVQSWESKSWWHNSVWKPRPLMYPN